MEKDLLAGKLGADGSYDLKLEGTDLCAKLEYQLGVLGGALELKFGVKSILLILKDKIPGKIDDALIDIVIAELEKLA